MLPGFTAEITLGCHHTYTESLRYPTPAGTAKVWPQQRALTQGPDGSDVSDAAAQTCTCPCCIKYHGQLVCC